MAKNLLVLTCFLLGFKTLAQNDLPERKAFTLKLGVDNGQFYQMDVEKSPYIRADNVLQIYPGEKVYIETELKGDTIVSVKTVKEIKFPERTITIELKQILKEDGKTHDQTWLTIKNPFDKYLDYTPSMFVVGRDVWIYTNILPTAPKVMGYEMWRDNIISFTLYNWRLKDKP